MKGLRICYATLALLARGGDVLALNTMDKWERMERPGATDGRIQVRVFRGQYLLYDFMICAFAA